MWKYGEIVLHAFTRKKMSDREKRKKNKVADSEIDPGQVPPNQDGELHNFIHLTD